MPVDQAAGERRGQPARQERDRKSAEDQVARPTEIVRDHIAEDADEIVRDAPANELGQAKSENDSSRDQSGELSA